MFYTRENVHGKIKKPETTQEQLGVDNNLLSLNPGIDYSLERVTVNPKLTDDDIC